MSEIIIEISKEAKIKTDFYIEVSIEDGAGSIFHNLPKNYSKEDVTREYELGIRYDIRTLFEDCVVSLDNITLYQCRYGRRDEHKRDALYHIWKSCGQILFAIDNCSGIFA